MKFIKYTISYLIVFLVNNNLIGLISIRGITPDILLIFLIFVSLKESQTTSTVIGFFAGLLQDLFAFGILGLASFSRSTACFLTGYFRHLKEDYSISYLTFVFFLTSLIHDRIYQFVFSLGSNQPFFKSFFYFTLPRTIYTTVLALIINFLFQRLIWKSKEF
jgi:rod shape-determining protein MreD